MAPSMTKQEFLGRLAAGSVPPLSAEIPFRDPAAVYEALAAHLGSTRHTVLLESVKGPEKIARYSFIAFAPYLMLTAKDGEVRLSAGGRETVSFRPPLERLKELVAAYPQTPAPGLPPFQGGAIGLLSYDFVRYIEKLPSAAADDLRIPDLEFLLVDRVVSFDHREKKAWLVIAPGARATELGYRGIADIDMGAAYDEAARLLTELAQALSAAGPPACAQTAPAPGSNGAAALEYEMSKEKYMEVVGRAKEYIAAGDIFQANLSQRIAAPVGAADPWNIYRLLRDINPSPFAAFADFGGYVLVSSSPERLVRVKDGLIDTRPIAGTRPRGRDRREDEALRAELLLNEKERAEHIMLIDLERNDIGRIAEYGSVAVDELMITEDYSHVIHIVSNVQGRLRKEGTCFDVIRAAFPGGTITGVPKVRCMEIIDELEPVRRGPYTGSLGYIGFSGNMDLNIIIRTFVVKDGYAYVQAGAGIVADSDPEREYYETLKKAEALLRTLQQLP